MRDERVLSGTMRKTDVNGVARVAVVLALAAGMLAGCGGGAKNDTFDLSATAPTASGPSVRGRQLLIANPAALKALDSENIVVRVSPSEVQYLAKSQWGDRLPRIVQAKLVQAFEDTGRLGGVGVPGQGLAIDYQLVADIRAFEIDTNGADRANVEISVKLLNDRNGSVKAQQAFTATVNTSGSDNASFVAALDRAFASVTSEVVSWTLSRL